MGMCSIGRCSTFFARLSRFGARGADAARADSAGAEATARTDARLSGRSKTSSPVADDVPAWCEAGHRKDAEEKWRTGGGRVLRLHVDLEEQQR